MTTEQILEMATELVKSGQRTDLVDAVNEVAKAYAAAKATSLQPR